MEVSKFIQQEVKKHLVSGSRKNKYAVIELAQDMPTFEGFILPYYVSTLEGMHYEVNVEDLYCYCDDYEEMYQEIIVKTVQEIMDKNISDISKLN